LISPIFPCKERTEANPFRDEVSYRRRPRSKDASIHDNHQPGIFNRGGVNWEGFKWSHRPQERARSRLLEINPRRYPPGALAVTVPANNAIDHAKVW
jgi:hypothetical protein